MNAADLIARLPEYTGGSLRETIEAALDYMKEEVNHAIPSFALAGGGPVLNNVFLFTASYLCDVHAATSEVNFDVLDKTLCDNIRVRIYAADIKDKENQVIQTYKAATVEIRHNLGGSFISKITYVGAHRDDWLNQLYEALPARLLLASTIQKGQP